MYGLLLYSVAHMLPPHFIGGAGGMLSRSTTDLTESRRATTSFLASSSASPIFSSLPFGFSMPLHEEVYAWLGLAQAQALA
jgi:hypothetical protein